MKDPLISVIIPAYNEEKYLGNCLQSLKKQTISKDKYEIVVVDNGSTDNTTGVAKQFRVKIIKYQKDHNISSVRHHGVKYSHGDILAFTDADITVPDNWLELLLKNFRETKAICIGGSTMPDQTTTIPRFLFWFYGIMWSLNHKIGKTLLWGSNMAIYKKNYYEIGGFDPSMKVSEDWDLGLRLQKKYGKKSVIYIPSLKVYSSIRKQRGLNAILGYSKDGIYNYINMIILGRKKTSGYIHIR